MSLDNDTTTETDDQGAADLNAALNDAGEAEFVVTAKPRRQLSPGTMAVGGILLCCAAITYFMYVKNGPKAASAATPGTAQASTTITQFLSSDTENVEKMKAMLRDTEKAVQQMQSQPSKTQVPLEELKTNPFRQLTTAVSDRTEEDALKKKREEILTAAKALKVQSILVGKTNAAMISGKMYQEGQTLDRFTIEKIAPGSVIIRCEKSRFELKMTK